MNLRLVMVERGGSAYVGESVVGRTQRTDHWWLQPLLVLIGLAAFTAYAAWAALTPIGYRTGPYLSPFYSPLFRWPGMVISPALLVLWAPLGFRLSCYYYRKAYYRALFLSPPACAVSEVPHAYRGEAGILRWLPILHRWFLYVSIVILGVLWWDALLAFDFNGRAGVGLGSIVLLGNACALTLFTFGCHAWRNVVGGNRRCFGCSYTGVVHYRVWRTFSKLTMAHPVWAWISLYSVALADLYVRLLASGVFSEPRFIL